mgnify:FL=1
MRVFHRSTVIVNKPLVSYGRNNLDFGKGFYTTNLQMQAEKWVQRFIDLGKSAYVNIYLLNEQYSSSKYRYKLFTEYNEEWLDFILRCRTGKKDYLQYDIIEGGIANDKVFNTVELYFSHLIDKDIALQRLKYEKPNNQICFVDQRIMEEVLTFEDSYEIKRS